MKKYLFPLVAAFALTFSAASAQSTRPVSSAVGREHRQFSAEERAAKHSEKLKQELGLSAKQTSRIKQILLTRNQEMMAQRGQAKGEGSREQRGAQMKASRAKYDAQFKKVLTKVQYAKYTQLQQDKKARGHHGPGQGGASQAGHRGKGQSSAAYNAR
ncbi:hypothetical protein [Hymenobacter sp. BT730]|uniref:hypothetical protein n=1 Tax=Hymenobacter sp. BT730 TaxID=3063332 RepID=UPI0026E0EF01|nr:hypothetical protein [Hymenobacter sp. BT730]